MGLFEFILKKLAYVQRRHSLFIILFFLLFTAFMTVGFLRVEFQGDMKKEMPSHLPIYRLNDMIVDKFGGQDTIFVLFELDNSLEVRSLYNDIRHPDILNYMLIFEKKILKESDIEEVNGLGFIYNNLLLTNSNPNLEEVIDFFNNVPYSNAFVNDDFSLAIMMVKADVGAGEKKVTSLTKLMDSNIEAISKPSGVNIQITGSPSIIVEVLRLLRHDSVYTIIIASLIIFLLLLIMIKSFSKTILVFVPLLFGLFWTIGALGWLNISISVATAGLGAMVLGLGVEYGIFILTRYYEERDKGVNQEDSLNVAVPGVGSAILGSGMTTIVGFLALTLSVMPMMQNLGLSLAIGIFFSIIAAIILEPAFIIFEENIFYNLINYRYKKIIKTKKMLRKNPR